MPSRDTNGKRIPGHAQRLRKAEREAPDPPARKRVPVKPAAKKKSPEPASAEPGWFEGPNPFAAAGPAPIDSTAKLITWGAKLHALGISDIAEHPNSYPNRREWLRALLDKTASLGMIRDKAAEQEKIEAALRREEQEGKRQGLVDVRGRKAPQAARPSG